MWNSFVQMELDAHTLYVIRKHRDLESLYGSAPAAIETAINGFNKQVVAVEQALADRDYLISGRFTAADLVMTSVLSWAVAYGIPLSDRLSEYAASNTARPAFKSAAKLNFSISAGA